MSAREYDAVVIGAGPNGLAAAIVLAQAGKSVALFESNRTLGGAVRSAQLTLPGFVHDVCSAVYPLAAGSPFFRCLPLQQHGLEWIEPPAALAHPFDDGSAVLVERAIQTTSAQMGEDAERYHAMFAPLVKHWESLSQTLLGPLRWPKNPVQLLSFARDGLQPARRIAELRFRDFRARAVFSGLAAHSMLPLEKLGSAAFGLVLGATAHAIGWPIVRGGAQRLAEALAAHLRSLGGEIFLDRPVRGLEDLPRARVRLFDVTPRQLVQIARTELPSGFRRRLDAYRYGLAAFKLDWALSGPVPWRAAACGKAATVHLGATLDEIAGSERLAWRGSHPQKPFVLVVQPSLFDPARAPTGRHTLWAYCHVPNGSAFDMTARVEAQIERFAPGFRQTILARNSAGPAELERRNANLVGGDINGGAPLLSQLFLRPTRHLYATPAQGVFLCSSATPPGGGVHGMCGYYAAQRALREFR